MEDTHNGTSIGILLGWWLVVMPLVGVGSSLGGRYCSFHARGRLPPVAAAASHCCSNPIAATIS